jgi:hypothetical protein
LALHVEAGGDPKQIVDPHAGRQCVCNGKGFAIAE